jgi:hypothetical protein
LRAEGFVGRNSQIDVTLRDLEWVKDAAQRVAAQNAAQNAAAGASSSPRPRPAGEDETGTPPGNKA